MTNGRKMQLASEADGFILDAYHVASEDARQGGLVLVQEIFEVIAPNFYDRLEPDFAASYAPEDVAKGARYSQETPWDQVQGDLQAAVDVLAEHGPVHVAGFCWGGTAAWLAACRCEGVASVSSFYGRRIPELLTETPKCPTILHFGKTDASIPMDVVEQIGEAHPEIPIYLYDAGHGFFSDRRADYNADCARLARLRTLQLFQKASGARGEHG